jgi:hypothetical protein
VLPRAVVKPLVSLKNAVDHAAAGNNPVEFELEGEGEIIDLARSIDNADPPRSLGCPGHCPSFIFPPSSKARSHNVGAGAVRIPG